MKTTSALHSIPHDLGHEWSVEVTQIETKNEWSVEIFECFLRFGATVRRAMHKVHNFVLLPAKLRQCVGLIALRISMFVF